MTKDIAPKLRESAAKDFSRHLKLEESRRGPRRLALLLFLFLFAWYSLTSSGRLRSIDEYLAYYQSESLVLRHSSAIPQALLLHNFYGRFDRFREPRAPYPPVQALAAAPFYALGRMIALLVKPPANPALFLEEFVTTLTSAAAAAAAVAAFFVLLVNLGFSIRSSLLTSLGMALTTLLWPYSGYFFSEPMACLLLALAAWVLFPAPDTRAVTLSTQTVLLGGVLLGALLWVRVTHALAAAVFCCALFMTGRRRDGWIVAACIAVSLVVCLVYNHYLFGGLLRFGYPDFAESGRRLNTFSTPAKIGLVGLLLSPGKSVFLYLPMIVPGALGWKRFSHRSGGLAIIAVLLPLAYLLFFMRYANWEGGRCPGPRYLLPALLFLCLPTAVLLEGCGRRRVRIAAALAYGIGFLVQVITMSTSFLEAEVGHGYYDASYNYQLWYSPLTVQIGLAWRYAAHLLPQQLGLGWDRWPVFLYYGGLSQGLIAAFLGFECLFAAGFGWALFAEYGRSKG